MNWLILLSCFIAVQQSNVAAAYVPNPEDVYSSLAFVFDTTGSMQDDFRQLKSHAEDIMTFVLNRNNTDIKHFVFVPFNDPDVGPVIETLDPKVILGKLNQVRVNGGGDCPEMGITAVVEALKVVKPNSYVYLFTDASPKDSNLVYEALELVQRKQTQVVVLRTGDNCLSSDQSYESIASLGSSSVFDVNKGDVSKVLEFIKTSMDNNQVNLLSVNIPQGQSIQSPKKLNIDESIKSLTVSVSGVNPTIDVVSPVGKTMDEAQGLLTDLDLKNVKIVNILEPTPGEWTLYVTSESAHTIRACGVSNKNFDFGFATEEPKNMTQTSHRPLKGAKNYVLINCPDVKEFLYCNIQGLNSDSKTLSLQISKFSKNLLLCGPFIPSSNPFYVQVIAKNNNDNYFKRITKTSIIPDEPDVPYITTPKKMLAIAGGDLYIDCQIESLVPYTAKWTAHNYHQDTRNFSQSSEIKLVRPNVTIHDAGAYACVAQNVAGKSESITNVTIITKPTIVGGNDDVTVVIYEGEDYSVTCLGEGVPTPKMFWLLKKLFVPPSYSNEHVFIINEDLRLIIHNASLSDSNMYTCSASNDAGVVEKHYNIVVKIIPTNSIANESLIADEYSDVRLRCPLTNMNNQWLKDGVNINDIIYKRADEQHFKQFNRELKIYELNPLDTAIYTCMSSNETYSFDLRVSFAPYFVKFQPETMMIKRNESVVFDCMTKGYPVPKVVWRKAETFLPITLWTLKNIEFLENKQKLKILSVDWIHNGTYSCLVKNKSGIEKRRFELIVF